MNFDWYFEGQERQSGIPLGGGASLRRACRFSNAPATSRLAGRQKGFVYWQPGLVTIERVGSLLILVS